MKIIDLPIEVLHGAPWNPNVADEATLGRLHRSISRYGMVQNLVVRQLDKDGHYEVLSGNQRLKVLKEAGISPVPCVVVDLSDNEARLLAEALNRIHGDDDLGLRAEVIREVLRTVSPEKVLALLPETTASLNSLSTLGKESLAVCLQQWEKARAVRLRTLQFRLTATQLEVVQKALARMMPQAYQFHSDSPNLRSTALYLLCKSYLDKEVLDGQP
ncbi:MAG: ParB N-terminal domain-containing protein [Dehalococcoidales bacterium]|nr:ParB N-terminal domain-containing protein [Dehalococcoidales bacterium]